MSEKPFQVLLAHCGVKPEEKPLAENILRKRLGKDLNLKIACPILNPPLEKDKGLRSHWPIFATKESIRTELANKRILPQIIVVSRSVYETLNETEKHTVLWIPNRFNYEDLIAELTDWKAKNLN